jgi:hypothetical protein
MSVFDDDVYYESPNDNFFGSSNLIESPSRTFDVRDLFYMDAFIDDPITLFEKYAHTTSGMRLVILQCIYDPNDSSSFDNYLRLNPILYRPFFTALLSSDLNLYRDIMISIKLLSNSLVYFSNTNDFEMITDIGNRFRISNIDAMISIGTKVNFIGNGILTDTTHKSEIVTSTSSLAFNVNFAPFGIPNILYSFFNQKSPTIKLKDVELEFFGWNRDKPFSRELLESVWGLPDMLSEFEIKRVKNVQAIILDYIEYHFMKNNSVDVLEKELIGIILILCKAGIDISREATLYLKIRKDVLTDDGNDVYPILGYNTEDKNALALTLMFKCGILNDTQAVKVALYHMLPDVAVLIQNRGKCCSGLRKADDSYLDEILKFNNLTVESLVKTVMDIKTYFIDYTFIADQILRIVGPKILLRGYSFDEIISLYRNMNIGIVDFPPPTNTDELSVINIQSVKLIRSGFRIGSLTTFLVKWNPKTIINSKGIPPSIEYSSGISRTGEGTPIRKIISDRMKKLKM